MRHQHKGYKLNRSASHRKAMLANLATSLIHRESIRTTDAKAKTLRGFAERMITFAKKGDLHSRRQVLRFIGDKSAVAKLFDDIAPRYHSRNGGYTRIMKLGQRKGDGASVSIIELVEKEIKEVAPRERAEEEEEREEDENDDAEEEQAETPT